jgi:hypothetical protein
LGAVVNRIALRTGMFALIADGYSELFREGRR